MRRPITITALALVSVLWASALVAAPLSHTPRVSAAVYAAGALMCHQRADRSFYIGSAQLPVCARCAGLYAGAVLGVFAWALTAGLRQTPTLRAARVAASPRLRRALIVSALPTVATVTTAWLELWDPANAVRAILALPLGAALGGVIAAVAAGDLR